MKLTYIALGVALCASSVAASAQAPTEDEVILHAWSWNLNTIAENMKKIADAGYTYVQTSPVQTCYVGEDGGLALFSQEGDSVSGKWYYYYQPIDWQIGNYIMGTRDDFRNMCDSARVYGVKVIVDVLPNHTAIDDSAVTESLINAVGGRDNLFHANGFTPITNYNDRLQCTTGEMGGLKDVNTENPDFQRYYLQYVNDLINLGARGFRYDTAKHIGLPSDPLDPKSERNNFWPVVTGRESVEGLTLFMPDSLYIYGEVLQDRNVPEEEYAEYMDMTASSYGHVLREALRKGAFNEDVLTNWHHRVAPEHLVTWVESHDTYCNEHESADMTDDQMRMGWVFLTARQHGRPLFFSRPAGSTRENYWGNNVLGARGNDEFFHPEVVAVNKFRTAMSGQPEELTTAKEGAVVEVCRGEAGAAVINLSDKDQKVKMATSLPDGDYTDAVYGSQFKVVKGNLEGKLSPMTSYIIYAK
ncbi:MAG: alpha-amylase [Muribaculaceae bacterium]|nr:alpha-amylase [Muribaculaceae bacterium]